LPPCSTVVELSTHNPKVEGSDPATGNGREIKMTMKDFLSPVCLFNRTAYNLAAKVAEPLEHWT